MKLTKATLKKLIKEELLKEGRAIDSQDVAEEARNLGGRIESELDDMDVDLSTLVANVDRMYQDFRAFLVDYVRQETGEDDFDDDVYADTHRAHMGNKDLAESRRRTRRK